MKSDKINNIRMKYITITIKADNKTKKKKIKQEKKGQ